jgi:hypothetical protein
MTLADTYAVRASFAQQRMWLLEQLDDDAGSYNSQLGLRFRGPLDRAALNRAVAELVRRHEILRTRFEDRDGELWQVIDVESTVDIVDLAAERERTLADEAEAELRRPFDLLRGPVLRARLVHLAAEDHVLLLTLDHLTCDGWSMGILHRDLVGLYAADRHGTEPPPEPAVRYADFAVWQRDWLRGAELERQLSFWRTTLADPPPLITFPADPDAPPGRHVGKSPQPLPAALEDRLTTLGRQAHASLFVVLTTAFGMLFSRCANQTDLVLGSIVANRTQSETDDVLGLLTNTVALRLDHSADPTPAELIARNRATVLAMQANQHVPFDRVVDELAPDRPGGRSPFFNVIIEFADVRREPAEVGGLRIDPMPINTLPIPIDLIVAVRRDAGGLTAVWQYDSEALTAWTVELLQEEFLALLSTMVDHPDARLPGPRAGTCAKTELAGAERETRVVPGDAALVGVIVEVWREVLGRADITAADGFFDLGGNSLAATRVVSRLRTRLDGQLRIRQLFERPVLADFAAALTAQGITVRQDRESRVQAP